jgi:hypothetical protein
MGEWRYSSIILDLGTRWRWVVTFTPLSRFTTGEGAPATHWIGGWVGPRAGLDAVEKRTILYVRPLQYRLSHPDSASDSNILLLRNSVHIFIGVKVIFVIVVVNKKLSQFFRIVKQQFTLSQSPCFWLLGSSYLPASKYRRRISFIGCKPIWITWWVQHLSVWVKNDRPNHVFFLFIPFTEELSGILG